MDSKTKQPRRIHSEAQRAKLRQMVADGVIKQEHLDELERNTPKHERLPERKGG